MDKIAFIIGQTFVYWQSVILMLAVLTAALMFLGLYIGKSGNAVGAFMTLPLAMVAGLALSRMVHWYCQSAAYASFEAAMTQWNSGGFALMGVFAGCLVVACLLRLVRIVKNLPEMLDCMAMAGAAGIAVGRLACLYSAADRGMVLTDITTLPLAYPVVNAVTGMAEYRLATFMLQAIAAAAIFLVLLIWWLIGHKLKKTPNGDITLLFMLLYGATQAILDSTRYDSLFLRSNGFVSVVQILGLLAIVTVIVLFSVRLVKRRGWHWWFIALWVLELASLGGAGYMEYYVQRHGDQALKAYTIMTGCLAGTALLTLLIRLLAMTAKQNKE